MDRDLADVTAARSILSNATIRSWARFIHRSSSVCGTIPYHAARRVPMVVSREENGFDVTTKTIPETFCHLPSERWGYGKNHFLSDKDFSQTQGCNELADGKDSARKARTKRDLDQKADYDAAKGKLDTERRKCRSATTVEGVKNASTSTHNSILLLWCGKHICQSQSSNRIPTVWEKHEELPFYELMTPHWSPQIKATNASFAWKGNAFSFHSRSIDRRALIDCFLHEPGLR